MSKLVEVVSDFPEINPGDYRKLNLAVYRRLKSDSRKLKGKVVVHVNSAPKGGGVAELLRSQVSFERKLGLKSHWLSIEAPGRFFVITKKIHNFLQGKSGYLSENEIKQYLAVNDELSASLGKFLLAKRFESGIVVIHDPQPLLAVKGLPLEFSTVLRLHIDLSTPNLNVLEFFRPHITKYDKVILSDKDYLRFLPWLKKDRVKIIQPAIDPFSEKNRPLDLGVAKTIMEKFEINCSKPIISQVSRFDVWKNPLGAIQAYYIAKNKIPDLQLVMAGFFIAQDDPEAIKMFEKVKKHAKGDKDIHLFPDLRKLKDVSNDVFINALLSESTAVVQESIREGFGLTITEAMWKGKAMVANRNEGSITQIENNKNGILVSSPEEAAVSIARLIKNKKLRERLGRAATRSVKRNFLISRFVSDNLNFYLSLGQRRPSSAK